MFAVEDRHWWYTGMKQITCTLIETLYPQRRDLHILDAGCGTGGALRYLQQYGAVVGCDISPLALNLARQRGTGDLCRASVQNLPLQAAAFDLIVSFDVLYHQQAADYTAALQSFRHTLRPGGHVLLRLPAYDWLRGHHDQVIHTQRRFTASVLREALAASQFTVVKLSYANTILFPLAVAKRLSERVFPPEEGQSDVKENPGWQDKLLAHALLAESRFLKHGNLPFGLSVVAIGRKE